MPGGRHGNMKEVPGEGGREKGREGGVGRKGEQWYHYTRQRFNPPHTQSINWHVSHLLSQSKVFLTNWARESKVLPGIGSCLYLDPLTLCQQWTWHFYQTQFLCQCEGWGAGVQDVFHLCSVGTSASYRCTACSNSEQTISCLHSRSEVW